MKNFHLALSSTFHLHGEDVGDDTLKVVAIRNLVGDN